METFSVPKVSGKVFFRVCSVMFLFPEKACYDKNNAIAGVLLRPRLYGFKRCKLPHQSRLLQPYSDER